MATRNSVNSGLSGTTGTGNFVGSLNPTISNPVINNIYDENGNEILSFTSVANAVNQIGVANAVSGQYAGIFSTGPATNVGLYIQSKGNLGVEIQGTTAGGNATTGYVGEYIASQILPANQISVTSNVTFNLTSISLTAGDWDVTGNIYYNQGGAAIMSNAAAGISFVSETFNDNSVSSQCNTTLTSDLGLPVVTQRFNVTTTTTVYLVGEASFSAGTVNASGILSARRVR
jgi:hypothetical protein